MPSSTATRNLISFHRLAAWFRMRRSFESVCRLECYGAVRSGRVGLCFRLLAGRACPNGSAQAGVFAQQYREAEKLHLETSSFQIMTNHGDVDKTLSSYNGSNDLQDFLDLSRWTFWASDQNHKNHWSHCKMTMFFKRITKKLKNHGTFTMFLHLFLRNPKNHCKFTVIFVFLLTNEAQELHPGIFRKYCKSLESL